MTREEAITVLENEKKCFLQNTCEPCECDFCRLMVPEKIILSAYNMAIAALREQEERRWIPVTERPKARGYYLVTVKHWLNGNPVTREAFWNDEDWLSCEKYREITPRVTHWMPLPEPPKEDKP